MRPNLFRFATSELSQDALLCWLLSWADDEHGKTNPCLHLVGKGLLTLLYERAKRIMPEHISSIIIEKQTGNTDILCIVNNDTVILVEDKVGTKQHSDQLSRYKHFVINNEINERHFTADNIIPVYIQTGDQSDFREVAENGYLVLERRDLLNILEGDAGKEARTRSDILDDFSNRLRQIEDDVQSFLHLSPTAWSSNSWKGFYTSLQNTLQGWKWDYVPNPTGGFWGFWWPHIVKNNELYLQLEQEKFCFKISVDDPKERHDLREYWHNQVTSKCPAYGLKVKRPDRFGNGQYMTIAILDQEYRIVGSDGLINMAETLKIIQSAQSVLDDCAKTV